MKFNKLQAIEKIIECDFWRSNCRCGLLPTAKIWYECLLGDIINVLSLLLWYKTPVWEPWKILTMDIFFKSMHVLLFLDWKLFQCRKWTENRSSSVLCAASRLNTSAALAKASFIAPGNIRNRIGKPTRKGVTLTRYLQPQRRRDKLHSETLHSYIFMKLKDRK